MGMICNDAMQSLGPSRRRFDDFVTPRTPWNPANRPGAQVSMSAEAIRTGYNQLGMAHIMH